MSDVDGAGRAGVDGVTRAVVLVGVPGAGATSVGREVARVLGVELLDTEAAAAAELGYPSVSSAFVAVGEEAFHEAEVATALAGLIAVREGRELVLVLGSGVLASPEVRRAAREVGVVELTVTLAHAAPRLGLSLARPVFLGNPRAQWTRLAHERRLEYAEVTRVAVDTDDLTVDEVAQRVLAVLPSGSVPAPGSGRRTDGDSGPDGEPRGSAQAADETQEESHDG